MKIAKIPMLAATLLVAALFTAQQSVSRAEGADTTAFLGVQFHNDNEMYEPTSDAERGRIAKVEQIFTDKLAASGKYRFAAISDALKSKIASGQTPGACGGCEVDYGKQLGTKLVAWVSVQKISNLILNMNIYIVDVTTNRLVFIHSADMRNNSDEGWERAINYLLNNYLLPGVS